MQFRISKNIFLWNVAFHCHFLHASWLINWTISLLTQPRVIDLTYQLLILLSRHATWYILYAIRYGMTVLVSNSIKIINITVLFDRYPQTLTSAAGIGHSPTKLWCDLSPACAVQNMAEPRNMQKLRPWQQISLTLNVVIYLYYTE